MRTVVARTMLMRTAVVRTMVVRVALTSTLSYRPNFLGTPTASYLPQEKCARSNQDDTKTHMKLCTARENMRNELQQCSTVSLSPARRKHTRDVRTNSLRTRTKCSKSHQNDQKPTPKHSGKRAQSEGWCARIPAWWRTVLLSCRLSSVDMNNNDVGKKFMK